MKVKILNITKITEDYNKLNIKRPWDEINALIVGEKQIILTDDEAVHTIHDRNGDLELLFAPSSFTIHCSFGSIPIKELINSPATGEEELGTWIRTFGSRIEHNYTLLLKSIKQIGLNPKDFPRKG